MLLKGVLPKDTGPNLYDLHTFKAGVDTLLFPLCWLLAVISNGRGINTVHAKACRQAA